MNKILIAIDFSDITDQVVNLGADLAAKEGSSEVCLMHVDSEMFSPEFLFSNIYSMDTVAGLEIMGSSYVDEVMAVQEVRPQESTCTGLVIEYARRLEKKGLNVKTAIISGQPSREICSMADEINADCIVVGAHRHGRMHKLFFREVSSYLIQNAPCPVLVTH